MKAENIAYACLTRHVQEGRGDNNALHWVDNDLSESTFTYSYFEDASNQLASILKNSGVNAGDTVSIFLPRSIDLINSFFAILKVQAVSCILFGTLGEEGLADRLSNSQAKVIITKRSLVRKILAIKDQLPELKTILVIDIDAHQSPEVLSMKVLLASAETEFEYLHHLNPETPAFLQYTSGSTGKPKGALHVHDALADMKQSWQEILQMEPGDVYWCTADPAWITGLVYGIISPFVAGICQVQFSGTYQASNWLTILERLKVNIWYTAPTALRMLMQEDTDKFTSHDFSSLKRIYSVGEPLNPEIYHWARRIFDREIYDTWWQSETGSMMIINKPSMPVKPGSMGKPRQGITAVICDEQMQPLPDGKQGLLCLRKGWGSMFRTYYRNDAAYAEKFKNGLYITGDLAWQDEDGYLWYVSRADDVINTAGHLVGPFEVESALLELDEIVDVAVIGADDPLLHKRIIAYVKLHGDLKWSKELELKCRIYVSNKVSTTAIPAEFYVIDRIPKNQSGKILRRVLKALYEGKDPGDLSTME